MPVKKAAYKSMRQGAKRHSRNMSVTAELKKRIKKIEKLIAANDLAAAKAELPIFSSRIDRAVQKNIVSGNTASRRKSRLARKVNAITAETKDKNV